jgi:hypothetical protein
MCERKAEGGAHLAVRKRWPPSNIFNQACVFVVLYVHLLYYMCIAVLTLDAGLLAISQYLEGPATDHLDTGFSWFPSVYKRMLRWSPSFQVATTCLSCSPPDLNFLVTFFHICLHVPGDNLIGVNKYYYCRSFKYRSNNNNNNKCKGTVHPRTGHEGPEGEQRYNATLSLTSALDGMGGQRHAPAALPQGNTRYPLYRRLGGPQGRSGLVRKISPPPGLFLLTTLFVLLSYIGYFQAPAKQIKTKVVSS